MNYNLTIGWLYPELMSTYGDRGNITTIEKRCEWRGININIVAIDHDATNSQIENIDLLFGGGAQDREQEIVIKDLHKKKNVIKNMIEHDLPSLFVCGAPQLMGNFYEPSQGNRIEGLGIFNVDTLHPGPTDDRLIGNIVAEVVSNLIRPKAQNHSQEIKNMIVGFENHGGRSYLKGDTQPFAKVIKGNGNNGKDGYEGMIYKNAIGCYFHGPLLPKNPEIADWLIQTALELKYKKYVELAPLNDTLELQAKEAILKKIHISGK